MKKGKLHFSKLIAAIVICEGVGILGSVITIPSISGWYQSLNKPFFNPPAWIFGPVWTLLYFLMGISLYLVWMKKGKHLLYFWLQLGLNFVWSFLFFGLHSPLLALIDIIVLFIMIVQTIKAFYKIDQRAGNLLLPYLAWVSFATLLNFSIWVLN